MSQKDLRGQWEDTFENANTRNNYVPYMDKLLDAMGITYEQLKQRLEKNQNEVWREAKTVSRQFKSAKGREIALCAFRNFTRSMTDVYPPNDKIPNAPRVKPVPYMTWEQALAICGAATPPYRHLFRLQAHCGWGLGEFLRFNGKPENWSRARRAVEDKTPYLRYDFPNRKSNRNPWYSLIPTFVLKEVMDTSATLPLTTQRGGKLDHSNYHSALVLTADAFRVAVKRAQLKLDPMPSPHEFRDTFRTHCTRSGVIPEVKEFLVGHTVDPLGYEKCMKDPEFVWSEVSKAYGPTKDSNVEKLRGEVEQLRLTVRMLEEVTQLRATAGEIKNA